jgi:hypothetical protein
MKRNELLNTVRASNARKAVEMALRPIGVTAVEMLMTVGMPHNNRLRALHVQGLATLLVMRRASGHVVYRLLADESLNAEGLRQQQMRREAYQRVQDEPREPMPDYDD